MEMTSHGGGRMELSETLCFGQRSEPAASESHWSSAFRHKNDVIKLLSCLSKHAPKSHDATHMHCRRRLLHCRWIPDRDDLSLQSKSPQSFLCSSVLVSVANMLKTRKSFSIGKRAFGQFRKNRGRVGMSVKSTKTLSQVRQDMTFSVCPSKIWSS